MKKTISVLGSTGSIGGQTLEVAEHLGIRVVALAAKSSVELLERQTRKFRPALVAVSDEGAARGFRARVRDLDVRVVSGAEGVLEAARINCGAVVNALVGSAGLAPTLAAIGAGRDIVLANKETLVRAGERVMALARERGVDILPADSEHSAIFQCMRGADGNAVKRVILTASGGPFRGRTREQMKDITAADALRHPTWKMGAKVTVDSATLMNKGLEYIEAMRLFDLSAEQIKVVIHPQSIIHSAVEFSDGAVIAQMGTPDMRVPLQYALTFPARVPCPAPELDFYGLRALTFEEPDFDAFPCLKLAMETAERGDAACAALSDANETAVGMFLRGELGFLDIYEFVKSKMDTI